MQSAPDDPSNVRYAPLEVVGYHGCSQTTASRLLRGEPFAPSSNSWDWLGYGVYFWEYAPWRALEWAHARFGDQAAVIEARIHLGHCLNLLDTRYIADFRAVYRSVVRRSRSEGIQLPRNTRTGRRDLDRFMVDEYCRIQEQATGKPFDTVRGCFPEGKRLFPGSAILTQTHVQLGVRNASCIRSRRQVYSSVEEKGNNDETGS